MDNRKVKGTLVLHFVKMVKKYKNLNWNEYLKAEDWEIINTIVLPAKWYPFDFYKRCSMAAFHLIGKGDLEVSRANGQTMARYLFETTYRSLATLTDPMRGLQQFVQLYGSLFNFSMLRLEKVNPTCARIFHYYDDSDKANIPHSKQLQGMFETLIQMTGGKGGAIAITSKQWEGAPATAFDITWK